RASQQELKKEEQAAQARAAATLYGNYLNGVALAQQLWLSNNVGRARQVLADCPPEHRRWEWHYLDRPRRAERSSVKQTYSQTGALAFSPDGRFLVTAGRSDQNQVHVYEAATGRELLTLPRELPVRRVAFSADGKRLALAGGFQVLVLE